MLGLVAVAGIVLLATQLGGGGGGRATTAPVQVLIDSVELQRTPGISLGNANAPVVLFEFADFQCPGCGSFARFVTPVVKDRWVKEGTVRFVFYDFPLVNIHPNAFLAARAGRCANEQERFWQYHDVLYGQQPQWSSEAEPVGQFIDYAEQVGADRGRFTECIRSDRYAREITQSMRFAESLGVNGTPTLFINGKRVQDMPNPQQLGQLIEAELAGMGRSPEAAPAAADSAPADSAGAR
ncbi:MAG TPA: DsbA family protein [Longimicrobiaceae bacterium]|nr:DsbA family protein [Longimicrobiaceae bacterium]